MLVERKILINIVSISSALLLWQIVTSLGMVSPLFLSSPLDVFKSGLDLISSGAIYPHLISSLKIFFTGYLLALFVGVFLGLLIGTSKRLSVFFHPYIFLLGSLPLIAIIPLFMIWFGVGFLYKVFVVAFMSFIPIIINTIEGTRNVDGKLIKMAKSFGAGRLFLLKDVVFFGSLPYIFSGMKISSTRGIVGIVIADLFGKSFGLGYLIYFYGYTYKTANLLFVIFLIFLLNLLVILIIDKTKKRLIKWS